MLNIGGALGGEAEGGGSDLQAAGVQNLEC